MKDEVMGRGERVTFSEPDGKLYDAVGVGLESSEVRVMGRGLTKPNAEAFVAMAVMRRGVDEEFFAEVPAGTYTDGQKWKGRQ